MNGTFQVAVNASPLMLRDSGRKPPSNDGAFQAPATVTWASPPFAAKSGAAGAATSPKPALFSGVERPEGWAAEPRLIAEDGANASAVLPADPAKSPATLVLAPRRSEKPTTIAA